MRSSCTRLSALLLLALAGCASGPANPEPEIDALEHNLMNLFRADAHRLIPDAIAASRTRYEALDDLAGRWRTTRLAALYALEAGNDDRAAEEARQLDALRQMLDVPETRGLHIDYETDVLLGRALGDRGAFQRIVDESPDGLERAVALAYLGDTDRAVEEAGEGNERHADRAMVHYSHGIRTRDARHLQRALVLYRSSGETRGIADCLFALARIAADDGERASMHALADRARRALLAIGDTGRADAIDAWLSRQ